MNAEDRLLAVALRMAQWQLDDAADAIRRDAFPMEKRRALAAMLAELVDALDSRQRPVIDSRPDE